MTSLTAMVVSRRRLLADVYSSFLVEEMGARVTVSDSPDAIPAFVQAEPDSVLLLDLDPLAGSTEATLVALEGHRGVRCGLFDKFTVDKAELAFELGISALIPPDASLEQIAVAVRGEHSTAVTVPEGVRRADLDRLAKLSSRELEVLRYAAHGDSADRIGLRLGITRHTVVTHRRRALRKLGVAQQAQAVALLAEAGLLVTPRTGEDSPNDRARQGHVENRGARRVRQLDTSGPSP